MFGVDWWTWFALCSVLFGGRLLHCAEPVEPPVVTVSEQEPAEADRAAR